MKNLYVITQHFAHGPKETYVVSDNASKVVEHFDMDEQTELEVIKINVLVL